MKSSSTTSGASLIFGSFLILLALLLVSVILMSSINLYERGKRLELYSEVTSLQSRMIIQLKSELAIAERTNMMKRGDINMVQESKNFVRQEALLASLKPGDEVTLFDDCVVFDSYSDGIISWSLASDSKKVLAIAVLSGGPDQVLKGCKK